MNELGYVQYIHKMKNKLSIIVPVYNVEQYLRKCVDSLLAQDISGYEIILVDDGSTDNSGAICDEYSTLYTLHQTPTIKVIHQPNGGLSAARNSGIKVAKGEYLMFVDSDDYIEPNVLCALIKQMADEQLDVLRYDFQNVRLRDEREYEVFDPNKYPHPVDIGTEVVDGMTYLDERMQYGCYAWQFIVRRALIYTIHHTPYTANNALFTEGIHFEDVDWMPRMMLRAKRVNGTRAIVYNYFWREGSITLTQGDIEKIHKNLEDRMQVIQNLSDLYQVNFQCRWLHNMISMMATGILATVAREFYQDRGTYIKRLRALSVFPLSIANQGKTYVRSAKLINLLGPNIYCIIKHLR